MLKWHLFVATLQATSTIKFSPPLDIRIQLPVDTRRKYHGREQKCATWIGLSKEEKEEDRLREIRGSISDRKPRK